MRLADQDYSFGVFLPMANGGWIVSDSTPPIDGSFALNKQVAQLADRMDFDFILSMMKWRGYGGPTGHWDHSLESMMLMAALSQVTEKVKIWATVHTLLHNPAVIAKMITTLDQASNGRAGLNIVSGAYRGEFEQMGAWRPELDHGQRYDLAEEWVQVLTRLWQEPSVDFDGAYYKLKDCQSNPKPIAAPRPDLICAGTSEVGLRYTAKYTDAGFVHGATEADIGVAARRAKEIGAEYGKRLKVFAMYTIVPGATDAEAEARVAKYAAGADVVAIANMAASYGKKPDGKESALVSRARDAFMTSVIAGSPKTIRQKIEHTIRAADLDGMMLIFPDYIEDLTVFGTEVLPDLRRNLKTSVAA
jgi:pyrimidine oxygenase